MAMLELADLWCQTIEAGEYANFLNVIYEKYQNERESIFQARGSEKGGSMDGKVGDLNDIRRGRDVGEKYAMRCGGLCEGEKWYHRLQEGSKKERIAQVKLYATYVKHLPL